MGCQAPGDHMFVILRIPGARLLRFPMTRAGGRPELSSTCDRRRDFQRTVFFPTPLDNVPYSFYLPAIPFHEEAFRERSTEAAGERSRGSGLTGPESRANARGSRVKGRRGITTAALSPESARPARPSGLSRRETAKKPPAPRPARPALRPGPEHRRYGAGRTRAVVRSVGQRIL